MKLSRRTEDLFIASLWPLIIASIKETIHLLCLGGALEVYSSLDLGGCLCSEPPFIVGSTLRVQWKLKCRLKTVECVCCLAVVCWPVWKMIQLCSRCIFYYIPARERRGWNKKNPVIKVPLRWLRWSLDAERSSLTAGSPPHTVSDLVKR